ncbi:hypothetical protein DSO57_1037353 [Entomophthora muscae]|uniref:Uncharacterized protein n=1 Tax=Entomophthora muscae TaxID=34485 RepID=A0ACC2TLD2_9FUNG|nr:hypothetical protein DSO57_1037353 [Entomophthora muscae]
MVRVPLAQWSDQRMYGVCADRLVKAFQPSQLPSLFFMFKWVLFTLAVAFDVDVKYTAEAVMYPAISVAERVSNYSGFAKAKLESATQVDLLSSGVNEGSLNGFVEAIHLAYANHHGLVLSPDHVYIAILQGLSIHINLNPESHRSALGLDGRAKEKIKIRADDFILHRFTNDWQRLFPLFHSTIEDTIDAGVAKLLNLKFTTSTPLSSAVASLAVMDSVKHFFQYTVITRCGIPEIELQGTKDDWLGLKHNALDLIGRFSGLEKWAHELESVLDEFIAAKNNSVNKAFWSRIYKEIGTSGGPFINGWINHLFPYLQDEDGLFRNEYLRNGRSRRNYYGPTLDQFPPGFTQTPFVWEYYSASLDMAFVGGFLGIQKHEKPNFITPALAWAVIHLN